MHLDTRAVRMTTSSKFYQKEVQSVEYDGSAKSRSPSSSSSGSGSGRRSRKDAAAAAGKVDEVAQQAGAVESYQRPPHRRQPKSRLAPHCKQHAPIELGGLMER